MAGEDKYVRGYAGRVVTASMVESASFCPLQAWRTYGPFAVPKTANAAMDMGTVAHSAMEWLGRQRQFQSATKASLLRATAREIAIAAEVDAERAEKAVLALARLTSGSTPMGVELSILEPLGWEDWQLGGTIDQYTSEFVMDFKTTGALSKWSEKKAAMNPQTAGYTLLLTRFLRRAYTEIRYYVVGLDTFETAEFRVKSSAAEWVEFREKCLKVAQMLSRREPPENFNESRCERWCELWSQGGCGRINRERIG